MKNTKKSVLNLMAKVGMRSAIKSAGAASIFSYHQPKEPKNIKAVVKK